MCQITSSAFLSRLGVLWGMLSLITLLTAFVSNVWLFTKEPVRLPHSEQSTTITFRIGLWRVCPSVNKTNISQHVPSPSCSLIKYSNWDDVKHTDLGVWTTLDFTPAFITRMRLSTPFQAMSLLLMMLATMFALIGHCNGDHKTLIAVGLYILGGLSLGGGLVIFASVLSDAYLERPRRPSAFTSSVNPFSPIAVNPFDYKYGWSFFAAGAAFIMAELAALLSITAYFRRFPTVEDMVRVIVPGADRHLRQQQGSAGEYLVQPHHSNRRRQNGPPNIWGGNTEFYGTKPEALLASDLEGVEGPLLLSNTAPDICSSNPTNLMKTTGVDVGGAGCTNPALSLMATATTSSHPAELVHPPSQPPLDAKTAQEFETPMAGVTVPITLMRQQPLIPTKSSVEVENIIVPTPTPFLYAQQLQRFGTPPCVGTVVHQGVLGVSEGASTSSSSSGGTVTGSCHSSGGKYSTLQPHKKKSVTISTFSTMDTFEASRSGTWSNSEV